MSTSVWFSEEFDRTPSPVKMQYLLCGTPRTGSNLLSYSLLSENIGIPLEYLKFTETILNYQLACRLGVNPQIFNPKTFQVLNPQQFLPEYIPLLQKYRTTNNSIFGCKVFSHHSDFNKDNTWQIVVQSLLRQSQNLRIIFLERDSIAEQTVSYYWGAKTREWSTLTHSSVRWEPVYDFTELYDIFVAIREVNYFWKRTFLPFIGQLGLPILHIKYEDLNQHLPETLLRVHQFLGVEASIANEPPIQKQSNPLKTEFVNRFQEDLIAHVKQLKGQRKRK